MFIPIYDKIRKVASMIEHDKTPSDYEIGDHKMLEDTSESIKVKKPMVVEEQKLTPTAPPQQRRPRKQPEHLNKWNSDTSESIKVKKPMVVEEQKLTPTAPPQQRRPRKQPEHLNKWNSDTKTELMNDYIPQYRADGRDKEVDGPKSTYKKKFKVSK